MAFLGRFLGAFRKTYYTKRKDGLLLKVSRLSAETKSASEEIVNLRKALGLLSTERDALLTDNRGLRVKVAMLEDEIAILTNRVKLMALGHRANTEFVLSVINTSNGFENAGPTAIDTNDRDHESAS